MPTVLLRSRVRHPLVDMLDVASNGVYYPAIVARTHGDVSLSVDAVIMICGRVVSKHFRMSIDLTTSCRLHSHEGVTVGTVSLLPMSAAIFLSGTASPQQPFAQRR